MARPLRPRQGERPGKLQSVENEATGGLPVSVLCEPGEQAGLPIAVRGGALVRRAAVLWDIRKKRQLRGLTDGGKLLPAELLNIAPAVALAVDDNEGGACHG